MNGFDNAISGIAGVIVEFVFGLIADWLRGRAQKQEQQASVRTLLRLEIEQNLTWLKEFWQGKVQAHQGGGMGEIDFQKRLNLIQLPQPNWSHFMWESQAALLPLALTENQLQAVFHFHNRLDRFSQLRSALNATIPTQYITFYTNWIEQPFDTCGDIYNSQGALIMHPFWKQWISLGKAIDDCVRDTSLLWAECNCIVDDLLRSNPLAQPTATNPRLLDQIKRYLPGRKSPPIAP